MIQNEKSAMNNVWNLLCYEWSKETNTIRQKYSNVDQ